MRRTLIASLILLILILIQSSPVYDNIRIMIGAKPDLVLIMLVFIGLSFGAFEGIIFGFAAGFSQDIISSGVLGLNALVFFNIGFISGIIRLRIARTLPVFILIVLVVTLFKTLVYFIVNSLSYDPPVTLTLLKNQILLETPMNIIIAPLLYIIFDRFSAVFLKNTNE